SHAHGRRNTTPFHERCRRHIPGPVPWKSGRSVAGRASRKGGVCGRKALSARVPESRVVLGMEREDTIAFYRRYVMKDGSIRTNPGRGNPDIVRPAGDDARTQLGDGETAA